MAKDREKQIRKQIKDWDALSREIRKERDRLQTITGDQGWTEEELASLDDLRDAALLMSREVESIFEQIRGY